MDDFTLFERTSEIKDSICYPGREDNKHYTWAGWTGKDYNGGSWSGSERVVPVVYDVILRHKVSEISGWDGWDHEKDEVY